VRGLDLSKALEALDAEEKAGASASDRPARLRAILESHRADGPADRGEQDMIEAERDEEQACEKVLRMANERHGGILRKNLLLLVRS